MWPAVSPLQSSRGLTATETAMRRGFVEWPVGWLTPERQQLVCGPSGPYVKEQLQTPSTRAVVKCERPCSAGLTAMRSLAWTGWQHGAFSQHSSPRAKDWVAAASGLDFFPLSAELGEDSFPPDRKSTRLNSS